MVKIAVIVAAGLGSRLQGLTKVKPKGFLEVEGISLIERSVTALLSAGIERILIGTGYLSEVYDAFASKYRQIETIKSDKFETTSSMYTLYNMREKITGDFLLLESDLLYEADAIVSLMKDLHKDAILASGATLSNDEVFIEVDDSFNLSAMSKNKEELKSIYGELVGISKISLNRYKMMCDAFLNQPNQKIDYEYIMTVTSKQRPFYVKKIDHVTWCEIDDEQHLHRALTKILPEIKAKQMKIKRNVLLNPGPATTTDTVKLAQVVPDICPREHEFGDLMEFVSKELTSIVADPVDYTAVLFGGSGTAAVEAMITSVVAHDRQILIINNGAYGKRMCQIAARYKMNYIEMQSSSIEPVDLQELDRLLNNNPQVSHVAFVHHETTTGLLNDLTAIGAIVKKHKKQLIVDAMSSFAAIPIDMRQQNVTYLAASSNKNIQGMAGVGFVIAENQALDALKLIEPRTFYLSLYEQYQSFAKTHQMRFTPPVQTLYALKQAIIEAKEEGIEERYARYAKSWSALITHLNEMNLKYLIEDKYHSKIITSIFIPDGVDFDDLHNYFYENGFTIYPGKVNEFHTFRIANIGAIDHNDIEEFVRLLKIYLSRS